MLRLRYDPETGECDLHSSGEGADIETAVLISLLTDALVEPTDVAPEADRAGWWGDAYSEVQGERTGSRLWLLLARGRDSVDGVALARAYALEALSWLVEDGIASAIEARATRTVRGRYDITISGRLTDGRRFQMEVPDAL